MTPDLDQDFKPNVDKLRGTLEYIERHPDEWDQDVWASSCGTAFCFAGHAVHMDDEWDIIATSYERDEQGHYDHRIIDWSESDSDYRVVPLARRKSTGEVTEISEAAEEVLGLHHEGKERIIFNGGNTLIQLGCYVEDIISGIVNDPNYVCRTRAGVLLTQDEEIIDAEVTDDES